MIYTNELSESILALNMNASKWSLESTFLGELAFLKRQQCVL